MPAPYPRHPLYPDGTEWLPATDLLRSDENPLSELAGNRPDQRERPLDHLADYLIRPLVVVLRELVDDPGDELFVLDPADVGFELTPNRRLTGRVVITAATEVDRRSAQARAAVAQSIRRFAEYLDEVALRLQQAGLGAAGVVVPGVIGAELRFLSRETAALLGRNQPWVRFVHSVDTGQDRLLRSVLRAVAELARRRSTNPVSPIPLITADAALADCPGLDRFARAVSDAGGELVLGDLPLADDLVVARLAASGFGVEVLGGAEGPRRIATLEMLPRRRPLAGVRAVPALSHTRSLEELQLGELRTNRPAHEYVVLMSPQESVGLVRQLVAAADLAAERTAAAARRAVPGGSGQTIALIRRVLTRKQFIKGSRSNYPLAQAEADMRESVRKGQPIPCVMMGFPLKQCENGLKAVGRQPDLAELGSLVRLRELAHAIRQVYPPGIRLIVLTDGRHFRPRSAVVIEPYQRKLAEYAKMVGCDDFLRFVDVDEYAEATLAIDLADREPLIEHHRWLLRAAFAGLDIASDPHETLRRAGLIYPRLEGFTSGPRLTRSVFPELFTSIAYSAPVVAPRGVDRMTWSRLVYDGLYDVDPLGDSELLSSRRMVLRHAWEATIRYVSTLRADAELGYERMFEGSVWMKAGAPQAGTCGFCFLGGSGLLPWHGTGAIGARGEVSTDFVVSLFDQAFVQVYSPLLGSSQPFMMVPVTATYVGGGERGARLDSAFLDRIRLRRR